MSDNQFGDNSRQNNAKKYYENQTNNYHSPIQVFQNAKPNNLPDLTTNYKKTEKFYGDLDKAIKTNEETGVKIAVYGFPGVGKSAGVVGWAKDTKKFDLKCYIFVRNGDIFAQLVEFFTNNIKIFFPILDEKIKFEGIINSILNPKEQLKVINKSWNSGRKLLILDDVMPENDADVSELLKSLEGLGFCVILTSRRPKVDFNHNQYLCVEFEASQELCMEILSSVYADNAEEKIVAQKLCEYVGNNTFAVEQIWNLALTEDDLEKKPTLKQLLEEIKKEKGLKNSLLSKEDKYLFHKDGVYQTLQLTWQHLNIEQRALALLCGQMALAPIPQYWFDGFTMHSGSVEKNKNILVRWLVINKSETDKIFKLHELWYKFLKGDKIEELSKECKIFFRQALFTALVPIARNFKDPIQITKSDIEIYSTIIPHLEELANVCNTLTIEDYNNYFTDKNDIIWPNIGLGAFYINQRNWYKASKHLLSNQNIIKKFWGIGDLQYLIGNENLASTYLNQSFYSQNEEKEKLSLIVKAKDLLEEIINKYPQTTGQEKLDYIHIIGKLASTYSALGHLKNNPEFQNKAIEYFHKSINTCLILLEDDSLSKMIIYEHIGVDYNNLAHLCINQANYNKGKEYYQTSIKNTQKAEELLQKEKSGDKSYCYNIATCYENLAKFYFFIKPDNTEGQKWLENQANYRQEAWNYAQKSMELKSGVLDDNHPEYKSAQNLIEQIQQAGWDRE